jgi:predicted nuclease of predicted toxin-antitoxin system
MVGMIRFYSNENLAINLVEAIRSLGYDVLTSYEAQQANQGIPDDEVLRYATINNRCVLTFNRGDFLVLHRNQINHCGIIACREERNYSVQVQVLHEFLESGNQDLKNRLLRLQKQNQPKSNQPIFIVREYSR